MAVSLRRKIEVASALSSLQPQIQRVMNDHELHKRARVAVGSGRKVYGRLGSDRDVARIATQLRRDKKAQKELLAFVAALRAVSERLQEPPKPRHRARNVILVSSTMGMGALVFLRRRHRHSVLNGGFTPVGLAPDM